MLAFDNTISEAHSADEITLGKANLVLKAAGLNASLITIEQLKFTAPVIFVKIYEAFFEDKLSGINYAPSCRDEHCHNAELVARALEGRYKYQFLERVSGASIIQGDKFSIESIIDLFYGVTQKSITHKATRYDSLDDGDDLRRSAALKEAASNQTVKQYYHSQKRYPNIIPGELKILMDRVTFLENKLHGERDEEDILDRHGKHLKKKQTKKKKARRAKSQSENIMQVGDEEEVPSVEVEDDVYIVSAGHSPSSSHNSAENTNNHLDESAELTTRSSSRPSSGKREVYENIKKQRRPTSAPLGGRPSSSAGAKKSPGRKIKYKTSSDTRDKEIASKLCPVAPTLDELDQLYKEKKAEKEEEERKKRQREEEFDKLYTYDTLTGRKLLITEMEQIAATRHRKETKKKRDEEIELEKFGGGAKKERELNDEPHGPTRAEWPGHRTATSAHAYVEKMTKIREPVKVEKHPGLNDAQKFAAYKYMENLDIVISVEHCCNCSFHAMSLRHKPAEYIAHANSVMKDLAQVAHQLHPCARVGVVRFHANITKKSKESDVNSRVGALEVQVAYKNAHGEVTPELIYSKLKTRRWPSKSVIEKRLKSFMSGKDIQTFEATDGDYYDRQETNGSHSYPVGTGCWDDTPLSSAAWQYTAPGTENSKFPVQWVFDSRDRASFPQFNDGAAIYVANVENPLGYTECHHRPGIVRRSFKSSEYVDMVAVKIKYIDEEIIVPEEDCVLRAEYVEEKKHLVFEMTNGLPKPLFTILKFAATHGKVDWKLYDDRWDKCVNKIGIRGKLLPEFYLCRSSFYQQIHLLAWQAVELYGADNSQMNDPYSEEVVDVQLGYSELCLDKIFTGRDGRTIDNINMSELLRNARIETLTQGEDDDEEEEEVSLTQQQTQEPNLPENSTNVQEEEKANPEGEYEINNLESKSVEIEQQESGGETDISEQQKIVKEAITDTILLDQEDSVVQKKEETQTHSLSFRERLQQVCLKIAPPPEGSPEAGPMGNTLACSKYKAGAIVIFESLDFDDNQELDIREFQEALIKFHLDCEDHEINKLRAGFDTDGDARITLHEFLQFLHLDNEPHRDLGDIWTSLRGTAEIDSLSTPESVLIALAEMEKDLFSLCTFDITIGSIVPATSFVDILDKYHLKKQLEEGDLTLLLTIFALDVNTKQPLGALKDFPLYPTALDLQNFIVKYDDFCSWLQPVDVVKVTKRISRFVNALIMQDTSMAEDHHEFSSLDDLFATIDPEKTGYISQESFQSTIDNLGLPVSRAEVRVLFRHFGTSDGESMQHANFIQMISGDHATAVSPVKGSRQFRKQSVLMSTSNVKHMLSAPSSNTLYEMEDVFEEKQDNLILDVFPKKYEPMMVSFSVLEVSGSALEQDYLKRFRIEIKFLLQVLEMNVGREHNQTDGKRHLEVDCDPLELSTAALNNNADISVQLSVSHAVDSNRKNNIIKTLGTTFFSPRKLMEFDTDTFFDLPLTMVLEDGNELKINMFGRLKGCHKEKISKLSKHAESGSYNVSFDDYKFDHEEEEEEDHHYSDHDHDDDDNHDEDFLANFSSPVTSPREAINPLEESKAGKEVEFDDTKKYTLNFKLFKLSDLENVEIRGANDNYVKIDLGSVWSMQSSVKKDSGSSATWEYPNNEHMVMVDGRVLHDEPIKIQVYDENMLRNDVLVADGVVSVTHATYHHDTLVVLVCDLKSIYNKPAGQARLFFEFEEFYVSDDPSHDDRTILMEFVATTSENSLWKDNMMWSNKTELKNWLGVDATHDTALGLHLGANNLNGTFSTNFCKLKNLTELELFNNSLCGGIPDDIGNLQDLRVLMLNNNGKIMFSK